MSYDPNIGKSLSFIFDTGGTTPNTACDAGPFIVSTFAIFNGVNYAIDYYKFQAPDDFLPRFSVFIPIADFLPAKMMMPSSFVTYNAPTLYTI